MRNSGLVAPMPGFGDFATDSSAFLDALGRNANSFVAAAQAKPLRTQSNVTVDASGTTVTTALIVGAAIVAGLWMFGKARR